MTKDEKLIHKFERWYKLTHWMAPELTKRDAGSYENHVVQAMYIAYRAGYNRSAKDRKEHSQTSEELRVALKRAYRLGQLYWEQAGGFSSSQLQKADVIHVTFEQFVDDTVALFEGSYTHQESTNTHQMRSDTHQEVKDV